MNISQKKIKMIKYGLDIDFDVFNSWSNLNVFFVGQLATGGLATNSDLGF